MSSIIDCRPLSSLLRTRRKAISYLLLLLAFAVFTTTPFASAQTAQPTLPLQQQAILGTAPLINLADARVVTWSSPLPDAINMHIVRAPDGLILFDTLRRSDQVADALKVIKLIGEPVAAIVITHAHTDHYGGLSFFRERFPDIPVYASEAIRNEMRDDRIPDNAQRRAMFGDRFPTQATINANLPDQLVTDGQPVMISGLRVVPQVMGPSESAGGSSITCLTLTQPSSATL